jgi:hypothetical protein
MEDEQLFSIVGHENLNGAVRSTPAVILCKPDVNLLIDKGIFGHDIYEQNLI